MPRLGLRDIRTRQTCQDYDQRQDQHMPDGQGKPPVARQPNAEPRRHPKPPPDQQNRPH